MMRAALAFLVLAACGSSTSDDARAPYPADTHVAIGAALPDLAWTGIDAQGRPGFFSLHDWYAPGEASNLLVIRVDGGAWCGTCRWHAAHTRDLRALPIASRLRFLDLVLGDADNAPATPDDLPAWRALADDPSETVVAADPGFSFRDLVPRNGAPLPLFVLVDTKTMRLTSWLSDPGPETLATTIEQAIAELDGSPPPPPRAEARIDGFFRRDQWDLVRDITPPGAPPPDPTDAVADLPAAAALGKSLFSDAALSPSGVSCATCHVPDALLTDGRAIAHGVTDGTRRTPEIALAAFSRWQLWDGRADSLWSQAAGPIENPAEMGSTRGFVAKVIAATYGDAYRGLFHTDPATDDPTRVLVNVGKSIEAFERTFRIAPDRLDRYTAGELTALSTAEKQGLSFFAQVGCLQCHWGPRLTDDAFHVTHSSSGAAADRGRIDGVTQLLASDLHGGSRWSDAPRSPSTKSAPSMIGAFKTPSLRGIANATHFGHAGSERDLVSVTELYGEGGDDEAAGSIEPWLLRFDVTAQWALAPFLHVLDGAPMVP